MNHRKPNENSPELYEVTHQPVEACPASNMKKDENFKRMMLVATGSAMAAGCEPCLNTAIPNLIEVKATDTEIKNAVFIGLNVNERKADIMKEAADILAGTQFLDKEILEQCTSDQNDFFEHHPINMLIAVGASAACNNVPCLEQLIGKMLVKDIAPRDIIEAIEIGNMVKEKPAGMMREAIDRIKHDSLSEQKEMKEKAACGCGN